MAKKVRIALIMGGGVSLGSFSAGATARIVELLQEYRESGVDARIDVMVGASAGAMTIASVMYQLFKGGDSDTEIVRELEDALKEAWIDDDSVGIRRIMQPHNDPSLIDSGLSRDVAKKLFKFDEELGQSAHSLFAEGTLVSFALTNLNGFPVRAEGSLIATGYTGGGAHHGRDSVFADALQTTYHHDRIRFAIHRNEPDEHTKSELIKNHARLLTPWSSTAESMKSQWETFILAGRASGAFPVAFSPIDIERYSWEYKASEWPFEANSSSDDAHDCFTFSYIDGGTTRNEPLQEAIKLAKIRDKNEPNCERLFIFVDPNISGTGENYYLPHKRFSEIDIHAKPVEPAPGVRMMQVGQSLMRIFGNHTTYREWLRVAQYNRCTDWFDSQADALDDFADTLNEEQKSKIRSLLESMTDNAAGTNDNDSEQKPFVRLVKRLMDIERKRTLRMVAITPNSIREDKDKVLLKGAFLANFGGFFDKEFRKHDFKVGRTIAELVMKEPMEDGFSLLDEENESLPALELDDPNHRDYLSIDKELRREFELYLTKRIGELIGDITNKGVGITLGVLNALAGFLFKDLRSNVVNYLERFEGEEQVEIQVLFENAPRGVIASNVENSYTRGHSHIIRLRVIRDRHHPPIHFFVYKATRQSDGISREPEPLMCRVRSTSGSGRSLTPSERIVNIPVEGNADDWFKVAQGMTLPTIRRVWSDNEEPINVNELFDAG